MPFALMGLQLPIPLTTAIDTKAIMNGCREYAVVDRNVMSLSPKHIQNLQETADSLGIREAREPSDVAVVLINHASAAA